MGYAAELAGLYQESVDAMDYARMGERIDAEIAALRAENERLRKREATLFEAVKRCERDVQRALREQSEWEDFSVQQGRTVITHDCRFRTACEAIEQRAAGLAETKEEERWPSIEK